VPNLVNVTELNATGKWVELSQVGRSEHDFSDVGTDQMAEIKHITKSIYIGIVSCDEDDLTTVMIIKPKYETYIDC